MVLLLMKEVINTKYEKDLIEKTEDKDNLNVGVAEFEKILAKFNVLDVINTTFENKQRNLTQKIKNELILKPKIILTEWDDILNELKKTYTILNTLDKKMKHDRHKQLGFPLPKLNMKCFR